MGALHPIEQALTIALAVLPFVVLALVVRRDRRAATNPAKWSAEPDEMVADADDEADQRAK